jgi:hypothetical protein
VIVRLQGHAMATKGNPKTGPGDKVPNYTNLSMAEILQRYADHLVDSFPKQHPKTIAAALEAEIGPDVRGLEQTLAIVAELRLRAAARVRKWPVRGATLPQRRIFNWRSTKR